jgi:hypothetical protein
MVVYLESKIKGIRESLKEHGVHIAKEEIDATGKFPAISLVLYLDRMPT